MLGIGSRAEQPKSRARRGLYLQSYVRASRPPDSSYVRPLDSHQGGKLGKHP